MDFFNIATEYSEDKNLKKEDVKALVEWVQQQPHLSDIQELQAIFFLKKSHYKLDPAKTRVDFYLRRKKSWPEVFTQRSMVSSPLEGVCDAMLITPLPRRTSDNVTIIFMKMLGPHVVNYEFQSLLKYYDMVSMLDLYQNGSSQGQVIVFDMKDFPHSYIPKLDFDKFQKYFYYMQELMPIKLLTAMHFFHPTPFINEFLEVLEPSLPKSLLKSTFVHDTVEELSKYIPVELLPEKYGGSAPSRELLQEKIKNDLVQNGPFFDWEEQQRIQGNYKLNN